MHIERLKMGTESSQRKYDALIAALLEEPCTREELQDKMICSKTRVIDMLRSLSGYNGFPRQVRITRWLRMRGGFCPLYALGKNPDAPKPKKLTAIERHFQIQSNSELKEARNAKLVESARKRRKIKYPNLHEDVLDAVKLFGNGSTPDIALHLNLAFTTTYCALRELEIEKKVMRTSQKKVMPIRWSQFIEDYVPEATPNQVVVKKWRSSNIKKQNPFSALGL